MAGAAWPVHTRVALRDHRLNGDVDIAAPAALIGDEARAAMLLALGSGQPLSTTVLARQARIGLPTASRHLTRLVEGGLLLVEHRGRSRYYVLAGENVARVVETLSAIAPLRPPRTLSETSRMQALGAARTCYDHLAGRLGVTVFDGLVEHAALCLLDPAAGKVRGVLGGVGLGPAAAAVFGSLGVDIDQVRATRRPLATACLDWTETRPHLAGALGAALCTAFVEHAWVLRHPGFRALTITDSGRQALAERLHVT